MHVQSTAKTEAPTMGRTKPYRVAEIAALLDVHPVTVYRDIEAGRLAALRVGKTKGAIRVMPTALAAYLTQLEIQPTAFLAGVA
jgi:excisionase family DNA binding protein